MKTVIAAFVALAGSLALLYMTSDGHDTKYRIGAGWVCGGWVQKVEKTGFVLDKHEIAAINAEVPVTTVDYNQYDSAQSSKLGERIMGLPRSK